MLNIIDFLKGFADGVVAVFDFIIAFFKDFMQFLKLLATMPEKIAKWLSWIPPEIFALLGILFGIVILYKILGREG